MGAPARTDPRGAERPLRRPQQARSRRTRRRILEAAAHCFEARGFDRTTTRAIADRAGIAVGTLYAYFPDKRAILLELLEKTVADVARLVVEGLEPERWHEGDPAAGVRALIDAVFHVQGLRPGLQRILWERFFGDADFRAVMESIEDRVQRAIERFLGVLADRGLLRGEIPHRTAARVVFHAVQWNAHRAFLEGDPEALDRTARATADLVAHYLFEGGAAPAARWNPEATP